MFGGEKMISSMRVLFNNFTELVELSPGVAQEFDSTRVQRW